MSFTWRTGDSNGLKKRSRVIGYFSQPQRMPIMVRLMYSEWLLLDRVFGGLVRYILHTTRVHCVVMKVQADERHEMQRCFWIAAFEAVQWKVERTS